MVVEDKDLPARMKEHQEAAKQIAYQAFEQVWNESTKIGSRISKNITGNDALSYYATIASHFTARWIIEMNKIAQADDAGIPTEEIIKDTLNGVISMLGAKAYFDDEDKPLPNGIKRLKS